MTGAFGSWRGKQLPEQLVQPSTGRPGVMFLASRQDAVYAVEPFFFFRMTCRLLPALSLVVDTTRHIFRLVQPQRCHLHIFNLVILSCELLSGFNWVVRNAK